MAAFDIYRMSLVNSFNGQEVVNVFHYKLVQTLLTDEFDSLRDNWIEEVALAYNSCFSNQVQMVSMNIRKLGSEEGRDYPFIQSYGQQLGEPVAHQTAPIVSWRTSLIGRSNRGRTYMPPCSVTGLDNGLLSNGQQGLLNTFAEAAQRLSVLGLTTWQLVVWSPTRQSAQDVTGYIIPVAPGVQRKRRPGKGS